MLDTTIVNRITSKIIANRNFSKSIVSICGAADLGKSYLSKKIISSLTSKQINASHLTMDSFMIKRELRNELNISGYCTEAYDLDKIEDCLRKFKSGESFEFSPYLHDKGKNAEYSTRISDAEILVFDGLHTMLYTFKPYIDYACFLYTTDERLKEIRAEADIVKRQYSVDFSKRISEKEYGLYKKRVEPYKEEAQCLIFLKSKWKYNLSKN